MKICRKCGESRNSDEFYASRSDCKACVRAAARAYRAQNLERVREYDRLRGDDPKRKAAVRARRHRYTETHALSVKHWQESCPEKRRAHNTVARAIRAGTLKVRPCERCGFALGVEAHHEDYSKPLDVTWLCKACHGERHREINEERRQKARAA